MTLTSSARCLNPDCDWTAEGDWAATDKAAEAHVRNAGHATECETRPA